MQLKDTALNSLDMYSLYSIERIEDESGKKLGLRYISGDGFKTLSLTAGEDLPENEQAREFFIETDAEDYYYEIVGEEWNFDVEEKSLKKTVSL